jgi:protein subunit release factor A
MKIEVSNGEIMDKLTILSIKLNQIKDEAKLKNVQKEYDELAPIVHGIYESINNEVDYQELKKLHKDLQDINQTLWNIEDQIRVHEKINDFEEDFIELARSVYFTNDERASVKKSINALTGSALIEEKSYEEYK